LLAFAPVILPGLQEYEKGPVPPVTPETLAVPFVLPHNAGVAETVAAMGCGCATVVVDTVVQPLASVIVTE
jgi:hypothetical protein